MTWLARFKLMMWLLAKGCKDNEVSQDFFRQRLAPYLHVSEGTVGEWVRSWGLWKDEPPVLDALDLLPPRLTPEDPLGLFLFGKPLDWFKPDKGPN
jgi:hypothetical protein